MTRKSNNGCLNTQWALCLEERLDHAWHILVSYTSASAAECINPGITKINLSLHPSYQQLGWQENWETYPFERPLHFALLFSPQVSSFMKKAVSPVNPYNWGCEHNSLIKIVSIATLKTAFEGVYLVCSTADRLINFCLLLFCDLWFVFLMHFEF